MEDRMPEGEAGTTGDRAAEKSRTASPEAPEGRTGRLRGHWAYHLPHAAAFVLGPVALILGLLGVPGALFACIALSGGALLWIGAAGRTAYCPTSLYVLLAGLGQLILAAVLLALGWNPAGAL
jgi:hypothetical protein